jgi:hypothetical protein
MPRHHLGDDPLGLPEEPGEVTPPALLTRVSVPESLR